MRLGGEADRFVVLGGLNNRESLIFEQSPQRLPYDRVTVEQQDLSSLGLPILTNRFGFHCQPLSPACQAAGNRGPQDAFFWDPSTRSQFL